MKDWNTMLLIKVFFVVSEQLEIDLKKLCEHELLCFNGSRSLLFWDEASSWISSSWYSWWTKSGKLVDTVKCWNTFVICYYDTVFVCFIYVRISYYVQHLFSALRIIENLHREKKSEKQSNKKDLKTHEKSRGHITNLSCSDFEKKHHHLHGHEENS